MEIVLKLRDEAVLDVQREGVGILVAPGQEFGVVKNFGFAARRVLRATP